MLLRYLNACLNDEPPAPPSDEAEDQRLRLNKEQICKWCTVLLDAHYTQMILSDHADLLVSLHESIRQQVISIPKTVNSKWNADFAGLGSLYHTEYGSARVPCSENLNY